MPFGLSLLKTANMPEQEMQEKQKKAKWGHLPYYPISDFYKGFFGEKVYKVPISVPGTCPNREGLNGMQVCNFCDEWGSAAHPENRHMTLLEQINNNKKFIAQRTKAQKFLAYFQSYTFSFSRVLSLREYFEKAIGVPDICGFVVGTRPDCVSDSVLDLWNEYNEKLPVFIEFGVQSFNDDILSWMKRGHTAKKSIWALERLQKKAPAVNVGIHLIFGSPNESDAEIIETAKRVNSLPIHNVKLHNLHVLKGTPLEGDFNNNLFTPIEMDEYARRVTLFIQHLSPNIPIHRLSALSGRTEELIAPSWTGDKMRSYQYMIDHLNAHNAFQGQLYKL